MNLEQTKRLKKAARGLTGGACHEGTRPAQRAVKICQEGAPTGWNRGADGAALGAAARKSEPGGKKGSFKSGVRAWH